MTHLSRILRVAGAALVAALAAMPLAGPALANGLGDLYVAVPGQVAEVYMKGEQVVTEVATDGDPVALAFSPDGASLFVVEDDGALQRIDIETISLDQTYGVSDAVAVAYPKGDSLFVARRNVNALSVLQEGESELTAGPVLTAAPDLLAADRHETKLVAAVSGSAWLAIVDPASGGSTVVTVDGDIAQVAIARDEGFAYVSTIDPEQVVKISLDDGKTAWTAELDGSPSALTAIPEAAIVAVGDTLYRVKDGKAGTWSTPKTGVDGPVTGLATSDEGAYVYVATEDEIDAVAEANPDRAPAATVAVAGAQALAPVPKASSLVPSGGDNTDPGAGAGTEASIGQGPGTTASHAPATDTEGDDSPLWRRAGSDPLQLLLVGGAIAAGVMVASRSLLRRAHGG